MTRQNESAFPLMPSHTDPAKVSAEFTGLSKREYFAAMAMQSVVSRQELLEPGLAAAFAVRYADALIAELAKAEQK